MSPLRTLLATAVVVVAGAAGWSLGTWTLPAGTDEPQTIPESFVAFRFENAGEETIRFGWRTYHEEGSLSAGGSHDMDLTPGQNGTHYRITMPGKFRFWTYETCPTCSDPAEGARESGRFADIPTRAGTVYLTSANATVSVRYAGAAPEVTVAGGIVRYD